MCNHHLSDVLCFADISCSISMEDVTVFSGKSGIIQKTGKLVIKDFLEVMRAFPPGKSFESVPFMVGDTPMTIEVFPNGSDAFYTGCVSIFLNNKSDDEVSVKCQYITDVLSDEFHYEYPLQANGNEGIFEFLTHAECEEAFKDKDFVVTAKVEIPGENVMLYGKQSPPAYKKRKFNVWEGVYEKMQNTDFALVFDGKKVVFCF